MYGLKLIIMIVWLFSAIPEDALNDESDNEDKENPDSRISSMSLLLTS